MIDAFKIVVVSVIVIEIATRDGLKADNLVPELMGESVILNINAKPVEKIFSESSITRLYNAEEFFTRVEFCNVCRILSGDLKQYGLFECQQFSI